MAKIKYKKNDEWQAMKVGFDDLSLPLQERIIDLEDYWGRKQSETSSLAAGVTVAGTNRVTIRGCVCDVEIHLHRAGGFSNGLQLATIPEEMRPADFSQVVSCLQNSVGNASAVVLANFYADGRLLVNSFGASASLEYIHISGTYLL